MDTPEDSRSNARSAPETADGSQPKRRTPTRWLIAILVVSFLFVMMPFLFWQATWFGRPLNDSQLAKSLADRDHPHEMQHALSQIADRILSPAPAARESARRFYPQVIAIADSGASELRVTAAWVMGQDNSSVGFHQELTRLLRDTNPMVRRNSALALVRFGDVSGREEIRALLQPYRVPAPRAGALRERLKAGDAINPGTLLGHITAGGESSELRSEVPGTLARWLVPNGTPVGAGQGIMLVDPSDVEIREALRALALIGDARDLATVQQFLGNASAELRRQAEITAQAIRSRS